MKTVGEIYQQIDGLAAFSTQEKWDNSGLLVGGMDMPVNRVYVTLDISNAAIREAADCQAQLMIAHHPVIFSPLKSIEPTSPVWQLIQQNMAAICSHTPLDMAEHGINAAWYEKMKAPLLLGDMIGTLENSGFGWCADSSMAWSGKSLAEKLRVLMECQVVRYTAPKKPIRRIAFCSGAGHSFLEAAIADGCDALITGDVKHDRWYAAQNAGIALFDCGHYHTERIAVLLIAEQIKAAFPDLEVICGSNPDPVSYVWRGEQG